MTPNYFIYIENILQEIKQISKANAKQTCYDNLNPNLDPQVNDVQLS